MSDPLFLTLDEVLAIHASRIELYGGSLGIRDVHVLESALAMSKAQFGGQYVHASIEEMAAAYLFHIARNHPFLDGNKRTALGATIAFLGLNRLWLEAPGEELVDLVQRTAKGELTKAEIAVFLKKHVRRLRT